MNRVHQAASLIVFLFCLWVINEALQMNYYTALGPGPGFFPFWLALAMAGLSAVWFVQLWLSPVAGRAMEFVPSRTGIVRVTALIASMAIFGLFVDKIGFTVLMFLFMFLLLMALGRVNLVVTLAISLFCSFGVYYIFFNYLNVPLPHSSIEFLAELGF